MNKKELSRRNWEIALTPYYLQSLSPCKKLIGGKSKKAKKQKVSILKQGVLQGIEKFAHTVYVLQEYFDVISALQCTVWR